MKNNKPYTKALILLAGLLFLGCETGTQVNKTVTKAQEEPVLSGIVDKPLNNVVTNASREKVSLGKIYSKSAQPGYYLQVGFFGKYKPNMAFMNKLKGLGVNYTVLNKNGDHYALVGAYKSYNQAKDQIHSVKSVSKKSFVIQVLRP